jgi:hypothetical protein
MWMVYYDKQTFSFVVVFDLLGSRERITRQVRSEIDNKDDDEGRGRLGKCLFAIQY